MSSIVTLGENKLEPYCNDNREAISMFLRCKYNINETDNEIPLNGNMFLTCHNFIMFSRY